MPPPNPNSPTESLVAALERAQTQFQAHIPEGCRIVATANLVNGQELNIVAAYPASPSLMVFIAVRNKQTISTVVRYEMIAQCTFHFEKGEPQAVQFLPEQEPVGFRLRSVTADTV